MNYNIPINGVAVIHNNNDNQNVKYWFKYKNNLNINNIDYNNIDYNNIEYNIIKLSDDNYQKIYNNHKNLCDKLGKQFYHSIDDNLFEYPSPNLNKVDENIIDDNNVDDNKIDDKEDENIIDDKADETKVDDNKVNDIDIESLKSMMNSIVFVNKINYNNINGIYIETIKDKDFINFIGTNRVK